MSRHQLDLVMCLRQPGTAAALVCERCDGRCPVCDLMVRPARTCRLCDECAHGASGRRCVVCGGPGLLEAMFCRECCVLERDRDGCVQIVNVGSTQSDRAYMARGPAKT